MRRLVPLLFVLPALGLAVAPATAGAKPRHKVKVTAPVAAPLVGIADQKESIFSDTRFQALGIRYARYFVAWDALQTPWQVLEMDNFPLLAQANGVEPLITFGPSRLPGQRRNWPSTAQFVAQFKAFRARYPWITTFATWNEANFCGQETCRHPELVARYYKAMKRACPSCRVLGADLLDLKSMDKWIKRFVKVAGQPKYWGFHNYVTANRFQTARTKQLLKLVKGQIWFTETGGLVARRNKSLIKLPQGTAHAAKVTRFILRTLPALSPRISRVYLYHWDSSTPLDSWDSGFVGADGRARPSLGILKSVLARIPVGRR